MIRLNASNRIEPPWQAAFLLRDYIHHGKVEGAVNLPGSRVTSVIASWLVLLWPSAA